MTGTVRMHKSEEILSITGVAKWLDVDRDTVREWVDNAWIPYFRIGEYIGFRQDTLLAWFAQLERENPANRTHTVVFADPATPHGSEVYKPTLRMEEDRRTARATTLARTRAIGSDDFPEE